MRKVLALLLCSFSLALFACGGVDEPESSDSPEVEVEGATPVVITQPADTFRCGTGTCYVGQKCCISNLTGDKLSCVAPGQVCPQD